MSFPVWLSHVSRACTALSKHGVGVEPPFWPDFWDRGHACARGGGVWPWLCGAVWCGWRAPSDEGPAGGGGWGAASGVWCLRGPAGLSARQDWGPARGIPGGRGWGVGTGATPDPHPRSHRSARRVSHLRPIAGPPPPPRPPGYARAAVPPSVRGPAAEWSGPPARPDTPRDVT